MAIVVTVIVAFLMPVGAMVWVWLCQLLKFLVVIATTTLVMSRLVLVPLQKPHGAPLTSAPYFPRAETCSKLRRHSTEETLRREDTEAEQEQPSEPPGIILLEG